MWDRAVLHLNVAHFAVAVERVVDARLRGRPVIVGREAAPRATVLDMSAEAFGAGIRKGMLLARARRLCRDASLLPPRPERYARAMRAGSEPTLISVSAKAESSPAARRGRKRRFCSSVPNIFKGLGTPMDWCAESHAVVEPHCEETRPIARW